MHYTATQNDFTISTDKSKLDFNYVHAFLTQSYWSPGVPMEIVKRAAENSMCFGIYSKEAQQVGYARVITDTATFAYIADVFVDERYRGQGLGKWLMKTIMAHPKLQNLRRIILTTKDAHKLYEQSGFMLITNPERFMIYNPAIVKNK
jgi:N-acetylglutamate synthase-like GNAT family acetyltransferase